VPLLNLWAPAYDRLARHGVHHGCDTILTGNGGDEWLNVTPCLSADLMRHGDLRQLAQLIGVFRRSFHSSTSDVLRSLLWTFGLRRLGASAIDRVAPISWGRHRRRRLVRSTPSWVAPDPAVRREMDARAERALPPVRPGPGGFYEYEMQLAFTHPLVAMEAEEHFEFGRRVGAEMLHPYLDADLVQLLYGMSPRSLMSGGRTKAVVRSTVARRFPDLGFERHRKVDATSFFGRAIQQEGPAAWRHSGGTPALVELGLVSPSDLAPVVNGLFAGEVPRENEVIWNVLNLEAWVRGKVAGPLGAKAEL
jgi:asparagine synthetase B (glutamine-hydrolysing)